LLEVRWVLESGALRLAIEKDTDGLIQTLRTILAEAQVELKAKQLQACEKLDQQFHDALVDGAGNDLLAASYHTISHRTSALRCRALLNFERVAEAIKEHGAILGQLEKGKVDAASKLLRQHIRQGRLRIVD
jgi:DNA-binding GntR family transcriptional regulator